MLLNLRKSFDFGGLERQRRDGLEKKKKKTPRFSNTIVVDAIVEPPPHWIKSHEHISVEPRRIQSNLHMLLIFKRTTEGHVSLP